MSRNARDMVEALKKAQACIATVESCTGGLLARRITEVDGCSEAFWGGWVTYDNSAKNALIGVPKELIQKHGAVSREVAQAMAEGGLKKMDDAVRGADERDSTVSGTCQRICVSTTGIAGPGGGTPHKSVGLCYVGVAALGQPTQVVELRTPPGNDRAANQSAFAEAAFSALEKMIQNLSLLSSSPSGGSGT
jgi:nicotinamide mononucleotide (NMN) deamidase PncC